MPAEIVSGIGTYDQRYAPQLPAIAIAVPFATLTTVGAVAANDARGTRVIIPRSGTLTDLAIFVGAASGNVDVGVYDPSVEPRSKLYSTGSIACPTGGQWSIVGNPNLSVYAGQSLDLVFACDNATATFARVTSAASVTGMPANFWPVAGGSTKTGWTKGTGFPLPATVTDSGLTLSGTAWAVMARVI